MTKDQGVKPSGTAGLCTAVAQDDSEAILRSQPVLLDAVLADNAHAAPQLGADGPQTSLSRKKKGKQNQWKGKKLSTPRATSHFLPCLVW